MWKRDKNTGTTPNKLGFSLVHRYIQHFNEVSGNKSAVIRRRSKNSGVVITQYMPTIPEGKSIPDFQCKPVSVTIQEGKLAVFKAVVKGDPKPGVTWRKAKGNISDKDKFQCKYDKSSGEYTLEIHKVSQADTDTYKCCAVNEYGKAVCTATLSVTEVTDPTDFRKLLRKSKLEDDLTKTIDEGTDERFWDAMLNADWKDYERICTEFGVTDLHLALKKLEEKKKERMEENCKGGGILFETFGKMLDSSIEDLMQDFADLKQMDVEEINLFASKLKLSSVDFIITIEEIKAQEGQDALFECVLTHPLSKIKWMGKGNLLEDGEKYSMSVSDNKLIHSLLIKDCKLQDKGIYSAVAGITSCSAWLIVEADGDPVPAGKKIPHKNPVARGAKIDLEKVAKEQQIKNQEEMEKIVAAIKSKIGAEQLREEKSFITYGRDGKINVVTGCGTNSEEVKDKPEAASVLSEQTGSKDEMKIKNSRGDGKGSKLDVSGVQLSTESPEDNKHTKAEQVESDKASGKSTDPNDQNEWDESEDATGSPTHSRRKRQGPLIQDLVIDPVVQFISGLSDVNAIIGEAAELTCKLNSEDCEGTWFRDGIKLCTDDNFILAKDGAIHKLVIRRCEEEHAGKYRFEADGRKTEAMLIIKDPPRFDPDDLSDFIKPVTVKVGQNAIFKVSFVGHEPIKIQWYREGEELQDGPNIKIEKSVSHSRLLLSRCQRKDTGEIKIKLKNEHGFTEAMSQLIVLDKPTSPLGPLEITESSAVCIDFKWRPPKDDGGCPVIHYIIERQQVGRNTWKKIGEIPDVPCYRDTDVDHGRKYCYRIRAVTEVGASEVMETEDMQAGTLAFPGPPAPPKVISAYNDCINLSWGPPSKTGGSRILGYILEKRKKGSNLWTVVNATDELIKEKKYAVKDVVEGMEYEFRVTAINLSGAGEFSSPSEFVIARDPKKPPGKVTSLKVVETSYSHLVLAWTKPEVKPGEQDEAKGYFVEIRQADCIEWSRSNITPIITTSFTVKGLKSMDMYWLRVIATNEGGDSGPQELANYILAMPSPVRPRFTNHKMKSFIVVKAGNSVRITINFEASPLPQIMWLKDNVPVTRRVTISNSDGSSQLLIPSSERSDSGIYSILLKNLVGQETFCTEVRVTDDPKPPGPVELEENVPGTVTVMWDPSPDEKRDDRLHYIVSKLDSTKHTWTTVADRLFNNKFTACNIMHGREYHFRVYAKNDMGISAPSESPTWGMEKKKEKFLVSLPTRKERDLQCAPSFIVPLKLHTAPQGYECYMSCAVKGNPRPRVTWYRNNISINTNTNYFISNTCGVCSMLLLRVGTKDMGEYTIIAENALGRAECSTVLSVRE